MGGATADVDTVLATGFSHGFGAVPGNRELVEWLRAHNAGRAPQDRVRFHGFDTPVEYSAAPRGTRPASRRPDRLRPHRRARTHRPGTCCATTRPWPPPHSDPGTLQGLLAEATIRRALFPAEELRAALPPALARANRSCPATSRLPRPSWTASMPSSSSPTPTGSSIGTGSGVHSARSGESEVVQYAISSGGRVRHWW
ncbi:MAG TPA: erythromycin esterase family protein [Aldersonia sp.]